MTAAELMAQHGSPLWVVDLDRVRTRLREFRGAWTRVWPNVEVAYSYKTNRLPAILLALAAEGAGHEVVCEAEYALARDAIGAAGPDVIVNGPVKSDALLERAAADGALVVVDSEPELTRAARAGVERVGLRVALPGIGVEPTRFGIAPALVPEAAARARALGLGLEALSAHLVSTGFDQPLSAAPRLGAAITVQWPPAPGAHAAAAEHLARLAVGLGVDAIDLGGGFPAAPAVAAHAAAVVGALRSHGFAGRLILEPGRALVTDAVALAFSVVAVKQLDDGDALRRRRRGHEPAARGTVVVAAHRDHRPRRAPDVARARQRPAVPERRRPAPGRGTARRGAGRRTARARRRCLSAGAIDALRRPAPRGGRPRRRPLAGLPAA